MSPVLFMRIIAFVMDNATNNDTMIEVFEQKCEAKGINFSAMDSRIRCMPHTAHLAALKLLEAIGVITKTNHKKASGRSGNAYPETHDVYGEAEGEEEDDDLHEGAQLKAMQKLRNIVKVIRGSPQCRQEWIREVQISPTFMDNELRRIALMLILDVKTRWSSTHQMLKPGSAPSELSDADWDAIIMVTGWLKSFRMVTTTMSTTKKPMLSFTAAVPLLRSAQAYKTSDVKN
ncbi:hypothetical protein B0H10DRAFT_2348564 [Mycena sp. CBHHK59/15]|nr:hypothetical protein B0H10DRAFT_2348564 [Mycena sp. CBHHK59/15]